MALCLILPSNTKPWVSTIWMWLFKPILGGSSNSIISPIFYSLMKETIIGHSAESFAELQVFCNSVSVTFSCSAKLLTPKKEKRLVWHDFFPIKPLLAPIAVLIISLSKYSQICGLIICLTVLLGTKSSWQVFSFPGPFLTHFEDGDNSHFSGTSSILRKFSVYLESSSTISFISSFNTLGCHLSIFGALN